MDSLLKGLTRGLTPIKDDDTFRESFEDVLIDNDASIRLFKEARYVRTGSINSERIYACFEGV